MSAAIQAKHINNPRLCEAINSRDIVKGGAKWMKEIKHEISKSFKKFRVSNGKVKPSKDMIDLFKKRENLKLKLSKDEESKKVKSELEQIECKIAEIDAEKNFKLIKEQGCII